MTSKTIKKKEKETISLYETNFLSFCYTKTKQTKPEYSMTSEDGIIIIISCDKFIYPKSKTLILDFSYENTSKTTILLPPEKNKNQTSLLANSTKCKTTVTTNILREQPRSFSKASQSSPSVTKGALTLKQARERIIKC